MEELSEEPTYTRIGNRLPSRNRTARARNRIALKLRLYERECANSKKSSIADRSTEIVEITT